MTCRNIHTQRCRIMSKHRGRNTGETSPASTSYAIRATAGHDLAVAQID